MKKSLILSIVCMALLGLGCAKESKQIGGNPTGPQGPGIIYPGNGQSPTAPTGTPGTPSQRWNEGATTEFKPVSTSTMSDYVAQRPLNNPTDIKINVSLFENSGTYGGYVNIGYYDNGTWHEGNFASGTGTEPVHGRSVTIYNRWFFWPPKGEDLFHGFFSDKLGAIVLVLDKTVDSGDGQGISSVSGSVWFKNFGTTRADESPTKCWFVTKGPYDCRTFLMDNKVVTASALYPNPADGYRKLGTFTGLDKASAFNE